MRKFDLSFRNDLRKRVEAIEMASGVELVVAILPRTGHYLEYYFGVGLLFSFLVLTVMMFIPTEIWYVYIYCETVGIGILSAGLLWLLPSLLRWIVGAKELDRRTQRRANAIFQQAHIHETQQRIGILVIFFWLERRVVMMPDRGVRDQVPPDELEALEASCKEVFLAHDPPLALLTALEASKDLFARYIPPDLHHLNELPDDLWIQ